MMKLLIFVLFFICTAYGSNTQTNTQNNQPNQKTTQTTNCGNVYDDCVISTDPNQASISGWLSNGYAKISGRNMCLDLFQVCKKLQK